MKLVLEELAHQQKALSGIISALDNCHFEKGDIYTNPILVKQTAEPFYIDVKMETGTGKTYVYTRAMYELFMRFGINKFIIFVPSLAIKEGTKSFIQSEYARQHFADIPEYENTRIDLCYINAGDFSTKKGRKAIPAKLMEFLEATRNDKKTIKCLLLNDDMLTSSSMTRNDYDQTLLFSNSCPLEAIKMVKPIVIIDEPHRFHENTRAWEKITELEPQIILRFGATFPVKTIGAGRNRKQKIDYRNLVYDLNAIDAFNQGLVKFIDVQYPENISDKQSQNRYKVVGLTNRQLTLRKNHQNNSIVLNVGDILPSDFDDGLLYDGMKQLSNGLEVYEGMELIPEVYTKSYQELLLKQAIDAHFEAERANWIRESCGENPAKIKTLALFFIDDIKSYRPEKEGAETWLKDTFERLLKEKLKQLIKIETLPDYKDFLEESLRYIEKTHAGYFSGDKDDKEFQDEVDKILNGKDKLLSFKDENGKWELCRFLFSKWTLKEGWDNPNVFTITKLRTSGSENSKIQEVGRGLRLPVDENGRRISNQEFRLNFIIDWSESDFANKLYGEITAERTIKENDKLEDKILEALIATGYGKNESDIIKKLLLCDIIDFLGNQPIIKNPEELNKLLPENWSLNKRAITVNKKLDSRVRLNKPNWNQLKDLWQQVVRRYMIKYESISLSDLENILISAVKDAFTSNVGEIIIHKLVRNEETGGLCLEIEKKSTNIPVDIVSYGKFLTELSKLTCVGVNLWHKALCKVYSTGLNKEKFNTASIQNIVNKFKSEFHENYAQRFDYDSLDFSANTSLMKNGEFVDDIPQNELGTNEDNSFNIEPNYLYDKKVYDSEPEKEILQTTPPSEIIVFGKLPKRCIQVPKYTGGTTSPDFVYAIKKGNNVKINLFVEAKPNDANRRVSDEDIVISQKKFFEKMKNEKIEWREIQ